LSNFRNRFDEALAKKKLVTQGLNLKSAIPNQDLLGGTKVTIFYLSKLKWKDKLK
jgi:hypothetical protein